MIKITLLAFKVLRNMAHLDLKRFQNTLAEEYSMEFVHLLNHLLVSCGQNLEISFSTSPSIMSSLTHASEARSDTEDSALIPNTTSFLSDQQENNSNRLLLNEIILLIGYFTLRNAHNQSVLLWVKSPTILRRLCMLPFSYFHDHIHKHILIPTLICACFENVQNRDILENELNLEIVTKYLKEPSNDGNSSIVLGPEFTMDRRFPPELREKAIDFFSSGMCEYRSMAE